jgi:hypothetical protein
VLLLLKKQASNRDKQGSQQQTRKAASQMKSKTKEPLPGLAACI